MKYIKTYEYHLSEDEIKEAVCLWFNANNEEFNCLVHKSDVKIEFDKQPYCEPTAKAIITIEEEGE